VCRCVLPSLLTGFASRHLPGEPATCTRAQTRRAEDLLTCGLVLCAAHVHRQEALRHRAPPRPGHRLVGSLSSLKLHAESSNARVQRGATPEESVWPSVRSEERFDGFRLVVAPSAGSSRSLLLPVCDQ